MNVLVQSHDTITLGRREIDSTNQMFIIKQTPNSNTTLFSNFRLGSQSGTIGLQYQPDNIINDHIKSTSSVIENLINAFHIAVILGHKTRESTSKPHSKCTFIHSTRKRGKNFNLEIFAMAPAVSDFSNNSLFFETIRMKTSFYAALCKIEKRNLQK
jgi:hypothetical protein